MTIETYFATLLHRSRLPDDRNGRALLEDLAATALQLEADDAAGRAWCREKGYAGYTSYGSVGDLARIATCFDVLAAHLSREAQRFAAELRFDLGGRPLRLDNMWVNVLDPGGAHSGHIHPLSVISGTTYISTVTESAPIRIEDPRLSMMMAAPPLVEDVEDNRARFVRMTPRAGDVLMWESWLRHEVEINRGAARRISISFNFAWR